MFAALSLVYLIPIFLIAGVAVWLAGIQLSNTTDLIDSKFGLGQALGGLIFLAITTNLPEIAIVVSAAITKDIGIATGNILGGIAIQTVVLVVIDGFGLRNKAALTYKATSMQLVLEGILLIAVLAIAIMGTQLPKSFIVARLAPSDLLIVITWFISLWLVRKARTSLPWHIENPAAASPSREQAKRKQWSTPFVLIVFIIASLITLGAGCYSRRERQCYYQTHWLK